MCSAVIFRTLLCLFVLKISSAKSLMFMCLAGSFEDFGENDLPAGPYRAVKRRGYLKRNFSGLCILCGIYRRAFKKTLCGLSAERRCRI